tara:strand:- start:44 stop:439 length:396 start_codon:yes stop_codon:yes gene_type:complete
MSTLRTNALEGVDAKNSITIVEGAGNVTTTVLQRAICNTWAVTNQSGTMAISDSINVSSVSDGGTGMSDYLFTVSYTTANYSTALGNTNDNNLTGIETGPTAGGFNLLTNQHDGSAEDATHQCFHICGDLL